MLHTVPTVARLAACLLICAAVSGWLASAARAQQPPIESAPAGIDDPPPPPPGAAINQQFQDGATVRAFRATAPFQIDGVIDEPFYQSTPAIREFVQGVPVEDGEPTARPHDSYQFVEAASGVFDVAQAEGDRDDVE